MKILTLCGSLRARSSNRAILRAYEQVAPAGMKFEHFDGVAALPHFNPDLDGDAVPPEVAALRENVAAANAVVISTPEYVHALPGSFKNALDWLVSDPRFAEKPVVLLQADRGSTHALESLREVLTTMSAKIIEDASVILPLGSNQLDEAAVLGRADLRALLSGSVVALQKELRGGGRTAQFPRSAHAGAPNRSMHAVTFLVRDYDEAITYFTHALAFELMEDFALSETKRWVLVTPQCGGTHLLLAKASTPEQEKAVGAQCGGRVAFFLLTDDFQRDYLRMREKGVEFLEQPRTENYGQVAVFRDLYGNRWDLLQKTRPGH
jgi:chromate reductase